MDARKDQPIVDHGRAPVRRRPGATKVIIVCVVVIVLGSLSLFLAYDVFLILYFGSPNYHGRMP